ncbi:hypothetical protein C1E23_07785 [Pseudoalteromonas phenolica]|uniref:Uncharacterized protein n=1 Tax=Pseudoalteromonas phenolica TaxID=161398 RepID=A0A4V2EJW4_9GAMM|nr:hypothetical protein [Pseudoalteromonas phenolica]RZQ53758.1 hypothetical protein C1E23_07785 [Pseudoalteromonas phenolica]
MTPDERLNSLSTSLCPQSFSILSNYAKSRTSQGKQHLINVVNTYIELLKNPLRTGDGSKITITLEHIRTHLCQNYSRGVVLQRLSELYKLTSLLMAKNVITGDVVFPDKPNSTESFDAFRTQKVPVEILNKIKVKKPKADEEFLSTLSKTCPVEIAARLKEHVYNFKIVKHHRAPLNDFLNYIYSEHPKWHEHPQIIEGSLLKYRNNLLNKLSRNSAYGRFQNVKNAINILSEHGLISSETDLPENLRRCTKTQKVRIENPLLCSTDIYDERKKNTFASSPLFINSLANELEINLKTLIAEAKAIVIEGYKKFKEQSKVISSSEKHEFLKHPNLRIKKTVKSFDNRTWERECNPFSATGSSTPIRTNNLVAYFDHFYECFIGGSGKHDLEGLNYTIDVQQYLGLTIQVASAMQILIVEELGINPYSLYRVRVHSDGHGHEFIQVTDDGSVRIRALKLRARHTKTKIAKGSANNLLDVSEVNISAATCLKMALEMTSRARNFTKQKELWLCPMKKGVRNPTPENFQSAFNTIRAKASKKSELLKSATLKKVRSSKGVLIYLNSRGDSLKTASYFGNTVKTTLGRYIPEYLTELVFRVKIRAFQNILLYMAIAHDESPAHSLALSNDEFSKQVTKAFQNTDMGGALFESLQSKESEDNTSETKYFCVSLKNIMLAIKYAKEGKNQTLKSDCLTVISMISEGPVIMKQLLRQAHKLLNTTGGN